MLVNQSGSGTAAPTHKTQNKNPNLLPVVRELPADLETPVSVYLKVARQGPSFLLESVSGGEQVSRYSFIGIQPSQAYVLQGGALLRHALQEPGYTPVTLPHNGDPLGVLRSELSRFEPSTELVDSGSVQGLPRFAGGLVGYLSYDIVRYFETTVAIQPHDELPEAIFLLADTLVAFDHAFGRLLLITNVPLEGDPQAARAIGDARLDEIQHLLEGPIPGRFLSYAGTQPTLNQFEEEPGAVNTNFTREQFLKSVLQAKEHIAAGDTFQIVLSQRLERSTQAHPFNIYRALRRLNPSPYMFFFDLDGLAGDPDLYLIGASPEMHVRLEGRTAAIRPIAGTRPRGRTPAEDNFLERELLADPKELAEHVMLVDLARNDLGRVCTVGSVRVPEQRFIERYSHVMHIVSQVEGQLRPEFDAFDLMRATFPAGTVSGAPKIRAMQIINKLEPDARGPYAGAVGYFSYDGSSDTCITLRTLTMRGDQVSVQAGAGIVADSVPENEYQETLNKARALLVAVDRAEKAS
jgi:anthranilate synthase component 1